MSELQNQNAMKRTWKRYMALWGDLKGWRLFLFYLLHYTVLFLLLQRAVFNEFYTTGTSFVWRQDGFPAYFTSLVYLSQTIRDGIQSLLAGEGWTIPLYDFRKGVLSATFASEPVMWLAVLWPWNRIDECYDFLTLLRCYLVGASFSALGFYLKQKPLPVTIGAVTYIFSGNLFGNSVGGAMQNPFFMQAMIYMPLLVIGAEELLRGRKAWLFTAVVFLATISYLYLAYMQGILIVIYLLIRYFCAYRKDGVRGFGRFLGRMFLYGGIGILLGGFSVIPDFFRMMGTGRVGREISIGTLYSLNYYRRFLNNFVISPKDLGNWTYLGFTVLSVPAIAMLCLDRERKSLRLIFLLYTAMLCIPAAGYVMSGFNVVQNRFCFTYGLVVAVIVMLEIPRFLEADRKVLTTVAVLLVFYFSLTKGDATYLRMVLSAVSFLALCLITGKRGRRLFPWMCLAVTCISVCYAAWASYSPDRGGMVSVFGEKGEWYSAIKMGQYRAIGSVDEVKEDESFFRVTGDSISREEVNSSFYGGLAGLTYFSSYYFPSYVTLLDETETPRYLNNLEYGYGIQSPLLSLLNVKYYALRESSRRAAPYGFEEIGRVEKSKIVDAVLKNSYALPVGYTYDSYVTEDEYGSAPAINKRETMLNSVLLEEAPTLPGLSKDGIDTTARKIPVQIVGSKALKWEDGMVTAEQESAKLTLSFAGEPNADTYLRIVGLNMTGISGENKMNVTANTGVTKARSRFTSDKYVYGNHQKTQILYLGNDEDGFTTCTVSFQKAGSFALEDLEIWCQPREHYAEQMEALGSEALENVETNWRGLTGTVTASKDKFLCFGIPYDKGWSAYVDGVKVKLYRANIGLMGVELSSGEHLIELKYRTPGLILGIVISCMALAVAGMVMVWEKRKQRAIEEGKERNSDFPAHPSFGAVHMDKKENADADRATDSAHQRMILSPDGGSESGEDRQLDTRGDAGDEFPAGRGEGTV